ncbi:cupin domain-containing protein [Metapseudomonas furukawaii]|jgi:mannose-6-phosphate isomerase-like protein (cupin superfamily)|uniref:Cupin type-2 domain-containing protein n=1 Tax=Metapseudomonas furukawaii TaxID=1149133 RepID=A0AAD1BWI3_METFU|nr:MULTISPECIES: cupin domain-containing protein [Pseudomonas]ELS24817.1 Cupin 2 [Pseudomonas furukawaii]OWJ89531.1 hypothetical protein B6S59_30445 [Pseudomonas sp. A46]WAG79750.1 cupin domain-containing protein [Pseudomonas furukawaii]BAU72345.1 hypothetical protein KF707C_6570 [Pseudomonas furukawaii]
MKAIDIHAALDSITAGRAMPEARHAVAFSQLTQFQPGPSAIHVGRFSGEMPWERHPDGDKLLQVLEGRVEVTLLPDIGLLRETVLAGSLLVIPRGLWHRLEGVEAAVLAVVPLRTEVSRGEKPAALNRSA